MTFAKAVLERVLALVAILVLAPILMGVGLLVWLSGPGGVIHRRRVLGRGGIPFDAFKFRTMVAGADAILARDAELRAAYAPQFKLRHDPRVTPVGRFLRRYSLDELPQLVNVLRGEMALVGPRMISPAELSRYGADADRLLSVRPGITGLWQVSGRQTLTYADRVRLDMQYVSSWNLWLDFVIVLRTLPAILKADGGF